MRYYFAPMEGLTDSVFRRLHQKYFPGVDRYYMPFFSPTVHRALTHNEQRELPKADSVPFSAVPQVLTKSAEDFLWAARVCRDLGYDEVNLNLGCPSGTVVAKGKGSGMLRSPEELDRFLDTVFQNSPLPVSVKTRIGLERAEEFHALLTVVTRDPIRALTVYEQEFGGSRNAMFRLKEHWSYLRRSFPGSEKLWKALRKTTDPNQFRSITGELFHTLPFTPASEEE